MQTLPYKFLNNYINFENVKFNKEPAHEGKGEIFISRIPKDNPSYPFNFIDLLIMPPDTSIGIHTHSVYDAEIYIIVAGQGMMHFDGKEFTVKEGDIILNHPGGTHGLYNNTDTEIKLVVIGMPSNL